MLQHVKSEGKKMSQYGCWSNMSTDFWFDFFFTDLKQQLNLARDTTCHAEAIAQINLTGVPVSTQFQSAQCKAYGKF